jgi:hypothetical protein
VNAHRGRNVNPGTSPAEPWRTLARASRRRYRPGDHLYLARGQTFRGGLVLRGAGTRAFPVVLDAYGSGAAPVIRGTAGTRTCVKAIGNHLRIYHVFTTGCRWAGFTLSGNDVLIEATRSEGSPVGIQDKRHSSNDRIVGNVLSRRQGKVPMQILLNGRHADVSHNVLVGPASSAIEIYGFDSLNGGHLIHDNLAVDNQVFSEIGKSRQIVFSYNVVTSAYTNGLANGPVGLTVHGPRDRRYGPVRAVSFVNNSVFLRGPRSQGFVCGGGCDGSVLMLRNNIFRAEWKAGYADLGADEDYDLYDCAGCSFADLRPGAHDRSGDPRFVAPLHGDFRLGPGSPAVAAGVPLGAAVDMAGVQVPAGAPRDLGAYQSQP